MLCEMKVLITILTGLLVGGCATIPVEELTSEELAPEQKALRASVVGEYARKDEAGNTVKLVYLANGVYETYENGHKHPESKWSIVDGKIHVRYDNGFIYVFEINKDKSIAMVATYHGKRRTDHPKEEQQTFKKIK